MSSTLVCQFLSSCRVNTNVNDKESLPLYPFQRDVKYFGQPFFLLVAELIQTSTTKTVSVWYPFFKGMSSTLICQFLSVAQFIETSTTKNVFLWYPFQRDVKHFGQPFFVSCPVHRNVDDEESLSLVSVSKGCPSLL